MSGLGAIHRQILEILGRHPEGISITQLRTELGLAAEEQQHLDRRVRQLDPHYTIERKRQGKAFLYILKGRKEQPTVVDRDVNQTQAARIRWHAGGRCEMCGRSIEEDKIKLHIDHKIPQSWGGSSEDDNLWALCSTCNEGKKDFFATVTDPRIQQAMVDPRVHVRIGELLKEFHGEPVPSEYLRMVAYTHDDWQKRLRELRAIGWKITSSRSTDERGRVHSSYTLVHSESWPENPAAAIREAEQRAGGNR